MQSGQHSPDRPRLRLIQILMGAVAVGLLTLVIAYKTTGFWQGLLTGIGTTLLCLLVIPFLETPIVHQAEVWFQKVAAPLLEDQGQVDRRVRQRLAPTPAPDPLDVIEEYLTQLVARTGLEQSEVRTRGHEEPARTVVQLQGVFTGQVRADVLWSVDWDAQATRQYAEIAVRDDPDAGPILSPPHIAPTVPGGTLSQVEEVGEEHDSLGAAADGLIKWLDGQLDELSKPRRTHPAPSSAWAKVLSRLPPATFRRSSSL